MKREERLGRRMFSKKDADRAHRRGRVLPKYFEERVGIARLSVDRLNVASLADVEQAVRRTDARWLDLQGWAVVRCGEVRDAGRRRVRASSTTANPYHADIVLPTEVGNDRELRREHAQDLAKIAQWQPCSTYEPPESEAGAV